jgi:hypothetical protein
MDYRLHGIPGPVLRRARARATRDGTDLRDVLIAALVAYGDERPSVHALGGRARAARLTPEDRIASARAAARARWHPP